jgi:hypothetical protein
LRIGSKSQQATQSQRGFAATKEFGEFTTETRRAQSSEKKIIEKFLSPCPLCLCGASSELPKSKSSLSITDADIEQLFDESLIDGLEKGVFLRASE